MKPVRASQLRQVAAVVGAGLLVGVRQDYAAAEHDVEEGVVGGDDALRPVEEDGATIRSDVALYDGWVDVPCLVVITFILSSSSSSSSSSGRGGSIQRSVQD